VTKKRERVNLGRAIRLNTGLPFGLSMQIARDFLRNGLDDMSMDRGGIRPTVTMCGAECRCYVMDGAIAEGPHGVFVLAPNLFKWFDAP
jgi:hypothetical protein